MRRHSLRMSLLFLVLLMAALTSYAQEGHGVLRILELGQGFTERSDFELFNCSDVSCLRIARLLLPGLFASDPATGVIRAAEPGERIIIGDPPILPSAEQQHTIQADLLWSDGTPISAYDVAFSVIGRELRAPASLTIIDGLRIDGERTFTVTYRSPDCTAQARLNSVIMPVASFAASFRQFALSFQAEHAGVPSLADWQKAYREAFRVEWGQPDAAASQGSIDDIPWGGQFLIQTNDGANYVITTSSGLVIDENSFDSPAFESLTGKDINLLLDPPFAERADLRNLGDIQLYEAPGYAVDRLVFNLSDPNYPRPAFIDAGPLEQLPHPILWDVRVRRAIRLAIDTQALIDGALHGGGVALNGAYSPASWAYDPSLTAWEYDPLEAERLLDEAGWRGSGTRRCVGCTYPERRSSLSLRLMVDNDEVRQQVAEMIRVQLGRVGIAVEIYYDDGSRQDFDLLLTGTSGASLWAREPDLTYQFTQAMDVLGVRVGNLGSYVNPELESLLEQARSVPTCSIQARADIYQQVQRLLNEELPATWLYVRNDFYSARGIVNFSPFPGEPLWNITDWVVTR